MTTYGWCPQDSTTCSVTTFLLLKKNRIISILLTTIICCTLSTGNLWKTLKTHVFMGILLSKRNRNESCGITDSQTTHLESILLHSCLKKIAIAIFKWRLLEKLVGTNSAEELHPCNLKVNYFSTHTIMLFQFCHALVNNNKIILESESSSFWFLMGMPTATPQSYYSPLLLVDWRISLKGGSGADLFNFGSWNIKHHPPFTRCVSYFWGTS